MEFESIGGNMYSLYDYSETPFGETIMCIEVDLERNNWWFVGVGKVDKVMTKEHMKALSNLLLKLLQEE